MVSAPPSLPPPAPPAGWRALPGLLGRRLGAEYLKLARSQNALVGFFGLLAFVGLWAVLFDRLNFRLLQRTAEGSGLDFDALHNGLLFTQFCLFSAFHLLFPIFVANVAGRQIAGEAQAGTLRYNLVRPLSRPSLYLAKWGLSLGYTFVLMGFFLVTAAAAGTLLFGWGDLCVYPNWTMAAQGRIFLFAPDEALARLALAGLLGTAALALVLSLALMLSALFENPLVAVVGTITVYLIVLIFQENPLFEAYRPWLFTDAMRFWTLAFAAPIDGARVQTDLLRCGAYCAGFTGVGLLVFSRRDVTS